MTKVKLSDIPVISAKNQETFLDLALAIKANGKDAKIFISRWDEQFYDDEKIVIVWNKRNREFGKSFTTKYFLIKEPGILEFGHDDGKIYIEM